jgi:hypothetical protein
MGNKTLGKKRSRDSQKIGLLTQRLSSPQRCSS